MSRTDIKTVSKVIFNGQNYREIDRLSYSQLALYNKDRVKFWKRYILKEEDQEESEYLTMGNIVDCLLTEPDNFDKKFVISKANVPVPQMVQFCKILVDNYTKFEIFSDCLIKSYEDLKEWNGGKLGTGFEKYVENFNKDGKVYFEELLESRNKKVISIEEATIGAEIIKKIERCEAFKPLGNKVLHKVVVLFEVMGEEMKCELDEICIDDSTKTIYPFDLKCTSFVEDFVSQGFLKNNYYIQASLYRYALEFWKQENGYSDYNVENFAFKVVDQKNQVEPLLFKCSDSHYEGGWNGFYVGNKYYKGIYQILEELKKSKEIDRWGISINNYNNKGIVNIPIFEQKD